MEAVSICVDFNPVLPKRVQLVFFTHRFSFCVCADAELIKKAGPQEKKTWLRQDQKPKPLSNESVAQAT